MTSCRNPPSKQARKTTEDEPTVFIVRRPYRWVRHPWYLVAIMLFWSSVDFTSDRPALKCVVDRLGLPGDPARTDRSCDRLWGSLRKTRACSDAHSLGSSNWDVVRSLNQLLFPPQRFWMREDSDPVGHQTGSWSILAEVDEFAAPEMKG